MSSMVTPFSKPATDNPREISFAMLHHSPRTEIVNGDEYVRCDGAAISAQSLAVGNSLLFNFRTVDNLSAGKMIDGDQCRFVPYSADDGTFDEGQIAFASHMSNVNYKTLPRSTMYDGWEEGQYGQNSLCENVAAGCIFKKIFTIKKDVAEQLTFSYQIHYVSNLKSIIIGHGLTARNEFVSGNRNEQRSVLWKLNKRISKFAQIITSDDGETVGTMKVQVSGEDNNYRILRVTGIPQDSVGWAITDENHQLILAENGYFGETRTIYLNFKESR